MLKKILQISLLATLSFSANAAWLRVMDSDSSIGYIDPTTIKNSNNIVRVWSLYDYKSPKVISNETSNSFKALYEFNCKDDKSRTLASAFYSGNMGSGKLNYTGQKLSEWEYIIPDTVISAIYKLVCSGKLS